MEISVSRYLGYSSSELRREHNGQVLLPLLGRATWRRGQATFSHCRIEHQDGRHVTMLMESGGWSRQG
jgi:hypothetical protein